MITFKTLCRAFQVHPANIYQLEARGTLPEREHGKITFDYVHALAEHRSKRAPLPDAALELLKGLEVSK